MTKKDLINEQLQTLFSNTVFVTNELLYHQAEINTYDKKLITEWVTKFSQKFTLTQLLNNNIIEETKPYRGNRTVYTIWHIDQLQQTYKAKNIDDYNSVHQYINELN